MTITKAVGLRIGKLLTEHNMSAYKLEKKSGVAHSTMSSIISEKTNSVTLKILMQIARGFDMSLIEFLDDEVFTRDDLEID